MPNPLCAGFLRLEESDAAFLIWRLGKATMRLAISRTFGEGGVCLKH